MFPILKINLRLTQMVKTPTTDKVADLYDQRQKETGEAQTATKARDNAIADLDVWFTDYSDIAIIALSDKPALLEILGLK